ncbi:MAG: SMI1/KNR4 family protein [Planctomycetes bacterium]|nr:SMI1/KNR4 family protein [Planctomycetota bacterium]
MGEQKKHWDATFGRVQGVYWPQFNYPPKSTAADLDIIEKKLEFHFPASYRAFAEAFGLGGEFLDRVKFLPLIRSTRTSAPPGTGSVLEDTRFYRAHTWEFEEVDWPAERALRDLRRAVVFATEPGYHEWVFDPFELTNAKRGECRIYGVDRFTDDAVTRVTVAAASFDEWLLRIDDDYNFDRDEERTEPEFPPVFKPPSAHPRPITYCRYHLPQSKSKPTVEGVALWLAWNNHTVRDLALSIRDRGQTDAFPILADALQEAGCDNADLLDSCRTGDPDIDGQWALQVLLGRAAK